MIAALKRDGWKQDTSRGAVLVFRNQSGKRVTVHFHPGKTYGEKLLKALINDIGWTEQDLLRLKLIKKVG
ncbi:MAG: addiction module toxin, HicA family [Firmicutes bacterium]|nr:addiction module toxin, HicA family [Bacillota bacterium]